MSSKIFLQALQSKLKGGNSRSIHLNALPGRLATRLDLKQLDLIDEKLATRFLDTILTKPSFEFKISFDNIDLNEVSQEIQKKLGIISKRMNSIIIENEDYFKEHGTKTLGFGYPILVRRSTKDPSKIIKAPLFIWPIDAIKSKSKVNEWSFFRNKSHQANGNLVDADIHSVSINEVLLSFIKGEDDIVLPNFNPEALEDAVIDKDELLAACADVLNALNSGFSESYLETLKHNFSTPVNQLPEAAEIDAIANNKAYVHFGGVFGLFRAQKESIITDISKLLERYDEFQYEKLTVENLSDTPFSAVNTDPAQQAIINTLGYETNQIIQGPPGTGKSQSLTALITNALANGLKCLVVCEKKTALDVIRRNIERANEHMGRLVAVIDDVNEDREAIVDSVRDRQNALPNYQYVDRAKQKYTAVSDKLKEVTASINTQHAALAIPLHKGMVWNQLVGRYLQLQRQFDGIPLKDHLNPKDFKFLGDENELSDLKNCIGKADTLYHQSQDVHPAFSLLSDALFKETTTGGARVALESFLAHAATQIPVIEVRIASCIATGKDWIESSYLAFPNAVRKEFEPYLPFIAGESLPYQPLPELFPLQASINAWTKEFADLLIEAQHLKDHYQQELKAHYIHYSEGLSTELTDYLKFINDHISEHGQMFMANTTTAKLKTSFFALFSDKYRRIKLGRAEVKSRIQGVRVAHLRKDYIAHEYNDHVETIDLSIYLNNIKALQSKTSEWYAGIPNNVSHYMEKITEFECHSDFNQVKQSVAELISKFSRLTEKANHSYPILSINVPTELNSLISLIPDVQEDLAAYTTHLSICRGYYVQRNKEYQELNSLFEQIASREDLQAFIELYKPFSSLEQAKQRCHEVSGNIATVRERLSAFRVYHDWRTYYVAQHDFSKNLIDVAARHINGSWEEGFECWYLFWLLSLNEPPNLPKADHELGQYRQLKDEFNAAQLDNVVAQWMERQVGGIRIFKAKGQAINSLFNKKGAKGMRRNSLRTIVRSEFELFTDFFPVILLNPSVCSSIIPLEEGIFDLVIFDEASQLRLEDTYAAMVRGKAKIVSGDKHQMAPSSYFEGNGALLDPVEGDGDIDEEIETDSALQRSQINLADSESLLAFAVDKNFKESYLTVHYRSRHPYLIDFSNHAFYGKRLIPVPAITDYVPITFIQVDGIYDNQTNKAEAIQVVALLKDCVKPGQDGNFPSVGVATFNIYQRNLILEEIIEERRQSAEFDVLMSRLGDSFFVKNLENIQGDERDIIIISNTFGRKPNGTFSQVFGPIIQGKGHRMLNVIITRAKDKVYICNSFPQEYVGQYSQLVQERGNKGRAVLYAYLTYARAVSERNDELRQSILDLLSQYCVDQFYDKNEPGFGSESVFEDEVYSRLSQHLSPGRIEQQYKIGGFRIDMIIHPKSSGGRKIAIECDGAKYHSSAEAYAWDVFRQEQLEKFGFIFYRIWSTNWWDSADRELENVLAFINKTDANTTNNFSLFNGLDKEILN